MKQMTDRQVKIADRVTLIVSFIAIIGIHYLAFAHQDMGSYEPNIFYYLTPVPMLLYLAYLAYKQRGKRHQDQ